MTIIDRLYPYQREIVQQIQAARMKDRSLVIVLPRMAGKSIVGSFTRCNGEAYKLAVANHSKPWARRWLKARGLSHVGCVRLPE